MPGRNGQSSRNPDAGRPDDVDGVTVEQRMLMLIYRVCHMLGRSRRQTTRCVCSPQHRHGFPRWTIRPVVGAF